MLNLNVGLSNTLFRLFFLNIILSCIRTGEVGPPGEKGAAGEKGARGDHGTAGPKGNPTDMLKP